MIHTLVVPSLAEGLDAISRTPREAANDWFFLVNDFSLPTTVKWCPRLDQAVEARPEAVIGVTYNALREEEPKRNQRQFVEEIWEPKYHLDYAFHRQVGEGRFNGYARFPLIPVDRIEGNLLASRETWRLVWEVYRGDFHEVVKAAGIPTLVAPSVFFFRWKEDLLCS